MKLETIFETKDGYRQARIKIEAGAQGIIMVGLDGWNYSKYDKREPDRWNRTSKGKNVRISSNSPLALTWDEWEQVKQAVEDAIWTLDDEGYNYDGERVHRK